MTTNCPDPFCIWHNEPDDNLDDEVALNLTAHYELGDPTDGVGLDTVLDTVDDHNGDVGNYLISLISSDHTAIVYYFSADPTGTRRLIVSGIRARQPANAER